MISVEIACALPDRQLLLEIEAASGATVEDVVLSSGIKEQFPDIDWSEVKYGVWYKTVKPAYELKSGDRVEIYRPLIADPKEVRKKRAEKAKLEGRADKVTGGRPDAKRKD